MLVLSKRSGNVFLVKYATSCEILFLGGLSCLNKTFPPFLGKAWISHYVDNIGDSGSLLEEIPFFVGSLEGYGFLLEGSSLLSNGFLFDSLSKYRIDSCVGSPDLEALLSCLFLNEVGSSSWGGFNVSSFQESVSGFTLSGESGLSSCISYDFLEVEGVNYWFLLCMLKKCGFGSVLEECVFFYILYYSKELNSISFNNQLSGHKFNSFLSCLVEIYYSSLCCLLNGSVLCRYLSKFILFGSLSANPLLYFSGLCREFCGLLPPTKLPGKFEVSAFGTILFLSGLGCCDSGGNPLPVFSLYSLSPVEIILWYNTIFLSASLHFSCFLGASPVLRLASIILRDSCYSLLAAKFKLGSRSKVRDKFGSHLEGLGALLKLP